MFRANIHRWLALAALLGASFWAHAQPTTYVATSTGNYTTATNFTACGTPPCQNFTTAMSVSGAFTTAAPLAANLAAFNVAPLLTSYRFSDGLTTYSSADPGSRIFAFRVTTNGSGAITTVSMTLERWLSGASPHAVGDRVSMLQASTAMALHNWRCSAVGMSPTGTADSCTASSLDTSGSRASPFTLTWALALPPTSAASIPTLSQWGVVLLAGLMGLFAFVPMRRSADRRALIGRHRSG